MDDESIHPFYFSSFDFETVVTMQVVKDKN